MNHKTPFLLWQQIPYHSIIPSPEQEGKIPNSKQKGKILDFCNHFDSICSIISKNPSRLVEKSLSLIIFFFNLSNYWFNAFDLSLVWNKTKSRFKKVLPTFHTHVALKNSIWRKKSLNVNKFECLTFAFYGCV